MKAVIFNQYGDVDVLKLGEMPKPEVGRDELLIQIHAVGLNPVDFKIRQGHLQELFAVQFPRILGGDISGVVCALGRNATDFDLGDEVYFSNPLNVNGGYAEYVAVDQKLVAKKSKSLSHVEAASLPVIGLTSIQALRDFGRIKTGSKVLIHAGAGGVGSFAIQYAKSLGAKVYATGSATKSQYIRSLGADRVIDYKTEDFVEVCKEEGGMDIVLETIGGENYLRSVSATKNGGAVPSIVNAPDAATMIAAEQRNIKTDFMLLQGNRNDLDLITKLVEAKTIRPTVSATISLNDIPKGHVMLESGRTQGKIVAQIFESKKL